MRGGQLRGALRRGRNRRTVAAALAMAAAALAAAGPQGFAGPADGSAEDGAGRTPPSAEPGERAAPDLVRAPVRIADAETVRLLRPGDRVDVIAAPESGAQATRVTSGARVTDVSAGERASMEGGALIVLSVSRAEAVQLAGASANSRLVVVLC
ncbi:hypothetical protein [Streptomyces cavernicola]|uniref:hypothetical protein n=1 Tax=Streptomyces cavernicola TaxID=3043613 RepID=UPI0032B83646